MPEKIRIYGEISPKHEADFLFIKGVFGCKNNGDTFEEMIDRLVPVVKADLKRDDQN